jgi:hypothetical protein
MHGRIKVFVECFNFKGHELGTVIVFLPNTPLGDQALGSL